MRMRNLLLMSSLLLAGILAASGGAAAQAARGGLALTISDPAGLRLSDVAVELIGPTDRRGETDEMGQISFASLQPGTYRLRFARGGLMAFEREVSVPAGKVLPIDITLTPAPAAAEPAGADPAAPAAGPVGEPLTLSIVRVLEQEFIGRQPRQESLLSCSGTLRSTMIQLNEPQPERLYDTADAVYYVVGGQGTIMMDGNTVPLDTNDFVSVPRGTLHALERRGSRPLVLLALLGGVPCESAR